jgi:predicted nucleotidyltransferase
MRNSNVVTDGQHLARARYWAALLGEIADVDAVCILGSVARGQAVKSSDIDLLVVSEKLARPTDLIDAASLDEEGLSLICRTRESFSSLCEAGAIFVLHVRSEGKVVFDREGWLSGELKATESVEPDPLPTFAWAQRQLDRHRGLARFNGIYHFAFARVYSVGRATAIALTVKEGSPCFDKDGPFELVAESRPSLVDPAMRLAELRPFYERMAGKEDVVLPFQHRGAHERMELAINDARALVAEGTA